MLPGVYLIGGAVPFALRHFAVPGHADMIGKRLDGAVGE
jgi:hypothetical protein